MNTPTNHVYHVNTNLSTLVILELLAEIAPSILAPGGIEKVLRGGDERFRILGAADAITIVEFKNAMTKTRFVDLAFKKFGPSIEVVLP